MNKVTYNEDGKCLTFTKSNPEFIAIVDCSGPLSVIREISPGICTAEQIKENLEELTTFLRSKEFKSMKNPLP